MVRLNHSKLAIVLRVEVTREDFYWQIHKRPNDSGVFLMRHMEAYMGNVMSKWDCGLETEGKKMMLGHLRKRYDATLVLLECNMHRDSIRAQLDGFEVVPTGRVVVPTGRYVVPAGKLIIIVSPGRLSLVPTGRVLSPGRVK
ncbi:hypothetical protein Tco_1249348 [Tanacetum coccineum]